MHDIDFLPQRYREAQADRSTHVWRVVLVVVVAAVVSSTAGLQIRRRAQLREHVGLVQTNLQAVRGQSAELPELERRMQRDEVESQLHTYLRRPWPRTQVLAALVRPLPDSIALTSIKIGRESGGSGTGAAPAEQVVAPGSSAAASAQPTLKDDLEQLRKRFDPPRTVIQLAGVAQDAVALHRYMAELGRSDLLVDPELLSVQSAAEDEGPSATVKVSTNNRSFNARVFLRPGFGHPGGPTGDEVRPSAPAAAGSVARRTREEGENRP